MKAVCSGLSGFIGSHLSQELQARSCKVLRVTQELLYQPNKLKEFFESEQPDYILHLATAGNYDDKTDVATTVLTNIIGTLNMLSAGLDIDYKKFIYFSSSSVLLNRETFYSASKASAERLCKAFTQEYGKPIVVVRPFTVIGKNEQKQHLIPTLINSCITGIEMPFVKEPMHDFIDVKDIVSAVMLLLEKGNPDDIYEIGSGESHSNEEVLELVEKIMGKMANLKYVDTIRRYDTKKWQADNHLLKDLGWKPKISLEESIKSYVE